MSEKKDKIEENVNNENKTEEQEKQTIEENNCEQMENGNEESVAEEAEKDPMQKMQEELDALRDKYLRSVAEFDNYRKRTLKEKAELILNGAEKTVLAILPVLDDMERAIENGAKTDDASVLKEGMELIHQKFGKILEGIGVKKIDSRRRLHHRLPRGYCNGSWHGR